MIQRDTTADLWMIQGLVRLTRRMGGSVRRAGVVVLGWLRSSNSGLLVMALAVGMGAGGGAIVFRWLIEAFTAVLSGHQDYAGLGHVPNPLVPGLGRWFVVLAPVVAGLLYGPLVYRFAREARGHGVPEVMFAVARRGGRIAPQVAVVKALASALCIGGGGSVGREGPIVQIGSALGSTIARGARMTEPRVRVLVACGAAGGIAATFNAPLAGVFFAMELILSDFTAGAFGMVVVASVMASVIGRSAFGNHPFLVLPTFAIGHLAQYPLFAGLGLMAGAVGVAFSRVLYGIEDGCDWVWRRLRGPEWARPAVGGLVLGGVLLVLPQMYGVGYPVLGNAVEGAYGIAFLVVLMLGKMVATSLTIGIGGSGGVFAPSLFIGAMLGDAYGQVLHLIAPGVAGSAGAYALIGMGAVFAGAARAPITAVVIMFELTGEYSLILPLMAAIVLATGLSHLLSRDTVYTRKLLRRGVDIDQPQHAVLLSEIRAEDAMEPVGPTLNEDRTLASAVDLVRAGPRGQVIVVDADGSYRGIVTAQALADALVDARLDASVGSLLETPETVTADQSLLTTSSALEAASAGVPVLDHGSKPVGWLSHRGVLDIERRAIARSAASFIVTPPDTVASRVGTRFRRGRE